MEFCPKCGCILIQKRKNDGCPRCGYASKSSSKIKVTEKIEGSKQSFQVVKDKKADVHPIVTENCKKCGHEKAYFWTVQTRSGDEAETKFFKCVKCNYTWREYR